MLNENAVLLNGDCLDMLKELPDNSVDSLITDPPAGISFMGKAWDEDKGGRKQWVAWMTEVMSECMRVLKPGAHGLVWAIPRTSHWTATALEDAGFEIRDVVTHIFGSGFPKSMDISKAIDKQAGAEREIIGSKQRPAGLVYNHSGVKSLEELKLIAEQSPNKVLYKGETALSIYNRCQRLMTEPMSLTGDPATDGAKQWAGWGTALKPASERWILCRKPMKSEELSEKTDTFNAQEWDETILSIEKSWHNILDALLTNGSKSTIKTKSNMITELRTLSYSILGFMQVTTTQVEMLPSGLQSAAKDVQNSLKDILGRLQDLSTISAQESVTSLADIFEKLIKLHQKGEVVSQTAPLSEDYVLVRKPISAKTVAANVLEHGTGGINIDASRIAHASEADRASATPQGKVIRNNFGKPGEGVETARPETAGGRFPANLVLSHNEDCDRIKCHVKWYDQRDQQGIAKGEDGTEYYIDNCSVKSGDTIYLELNPLITERPCGVNIRLTSCTPGCAVATLDEQSGISKSTGGKPKHSHNWVGFSGIQTGGNLGGLGDTGGASRFFYVAKASKKDKGADNTHPTVKSSSLMTYLINLITPPGGIVLDPFMGSGSTGVAARKEGFDFIGIEKESEYFAICEKRIK